MLTVIDDERIGFDITNIVIRGAGDGRTDPRDGQLYGPCGRGGFEMIANTATANKVSDAASGAAEWNVN